MPLWTKQDLMTACKASDPTSNFLNNFDNIHGIRNSDWFIILGGDGHQPATEPGNPNIVYAQWQQGNLNRHDRITGENVNIKPQPELGEKTERFNWDAPILVSPHNSKRLYFGSQRVWKSEDRGDSWETISDDITKNIEKRTMIEPTRKLKVNCSSKNTMPIIVAKKT